MNVKQILNEHNDYRHQSDITFMAVKLMPRRLQEGADAGYTSFSFTEARNELEKLYAVARSKGIIRKVS